MSDILHILAMRINNKADEFSSLLREHGIFSVLVRDLTSDVIRNSKVILIDAHCDQRFLCKFSADLEYHLSAGGTVVFNGHLEYPIFKELASFQVAQGRGRSDLLIERVHSHPVFNQVDCQDISLRRGVAGFYARGANPPPEGAVVLHRLVKDHSPIDWIWKRPAGGQIFMHSGNNMWMYINDETSAKYITPQLIEWISSGATYNFAGY